MLKKIVLLILVVSLALSAVSCNFSISADTADSDSRGETETEKAPDTAKETKAPDTDPPETDPPAIDNPRYTMNSMPDVKVDWIQYYNSDLGYRFFIYQKGGSFGTLDANGNVISKAAYDFVDYGYSSNIEKYNGKKALYGYKNSENGCYLIDENGSFNKAELYGWGIESMGKVYWYKGGPIILDNWEGKLDYSASEYKSYAHCRNMIADYLYFIDAKQIPVREITNYPVPEGEDYGINIYDVTFKSEKYAIFDVDSGKLVTDFIFDNVYPDFSVGGVMAVEKNDKWAYITSDGELLTDYIYDPADIYEEYDWQKNDGSMAEMDMMFMPVNGYIVTRTYDGGYGLIDTDGNVIIENEYQFVSQVSPEGVFWVEQNDSWSVCVISDT